MLKKIVISVAVLSLANLAIAEETGFEVEETTQQEQSATKYLFANAGGKYLKGTIGSRYIYGATAGIDYPINNGKVYLKTNISKQKLTLELEQESWARKYYPGDPEKKEVVIKKSYSTVEEAFIEKSFGNASISAGRSKIVFSDAPGITPLTYLTPNKTLSSGFEGATLDSLIAQDNIQIAYNVSDNIEIRGYYIIGANIDPFEKEAKKSSTQSNHSTKVKDEFEEHSMGLDDKVAGSKAVALTYYPSWGKLKLLYSDGFDMNGLQNDSTISKQTHKFGGTGEEYTTYQLKGDYNLSKAKAYGLSVDWKYTPNVDLGIEAIQVDTTGEVNVENEQEITSKINSNEDGAGDRVSAIDYLYEHNNGSNRVPATFSLVAFKTSYKSGRWTLGGNIMFLKIKYSDVATKAKELLRKSRGQSENEEELQYIGGAVFNYDLNSDGTKSISGFAGAMPIIGGLAVGYNQEVNDNLSFSVNSMAGKFLKDETLAEAFGGDKYKQGRDFEIFLGMSFNYKL